MSGIPGLEPEKKVEGEEVGGEADEEAGTKAELTSIEEVIGTSKVYPTPILEEATMNLEVQT